MTALTSFSRSMLDLYPGVPDGLLPDDNPFVREGNRVFCRFDQLGIKNTEDQPYGLLFGFS